MVDLLKMKVMLYRLIVAVVTMEHLKTALCAFYIQSTHWQSGPWRRTSAYQLFNVSQMSTKVDTLLMLSFVCWNVVNVYLLFFVGLQDGRRQR